MHKKGLPIGGPFYAFVHEMQDSKQMTAGQ
jgi:hypothetical protein